MKLSRCFALALCGIGSYASAADYAGDFLVNLSNPNGDWSYGYSSSTPGSAITLFTEYFDDTVNFGWRTNLSLGTPVAFKNHVNGSAGLHPGPSNEIAIARWTALSAGSYQVSGMFGIGDIGAVDGYVLHNDVIVFSALNTVLDAPFDLTLDVAAGDRIDFGVGSASSFYFDTTPLDAHIEAVPEPASLAILGMGALTLLRRRARRT